MTIRAATARLAVTLIALVTALLGLVVALVRLATAGALWTARAIPAHSQRVSGVECAAQGPVAVRTPRPALRLIPAPAAPAGPSAAAVRLEGALVGLGFKVGDARRVVAGLGDRVEREPIADLIKTALATLSRAA
jgi:hypothetical protein